jgi:hypothetical protein
MKFSKVIQNSTFGVEFELCVCLLNHDEHDDDLLDHYLSILNRAGNEEFITQGVTLDYSKWQLVGDLSIKCGYKYIRKEIQEYLFHLLSTQVAIDRDLKRLLYNVKGDKVLIQEYYKYQMLLEKLNSLMYDINSNETDEQILVNLNELNQHLNDDEFEEVGKDMLFSDRPQNTRSVSKIKQANKEVTEKFIQDSIEQLKMQIKLVNHYVKTTGRIIHDKIPTNREDIDNCIENTFPIEVVSKKYKYTELEQFQYAVDNNIFNNDVVYELNTSQALHISIGNSIIQNEDKTRRWLRNLLNFWYKFEKSILNQVPSFRTEKQLEGYNERILYAEPLQTKLGENLDKMITKDGHSAAECSAGEPLHEEWEWFFACKEGGKNIYGNYKDFTAINIKGLNLHDDHSITYSDNVYIEFRMLPHLPNTELLKNWIILLTFFVTLALSDDFQTCYDKLTLDNIFSGKFGWYKQIWVYLKTTKNIEYDDFYEWESKYNLHNETNISLTDFTSEILGSTLGRARFNTPHTNTTTY